MQSPSHHTRNGRARHCTDGPAASVAILPRIFERGVRRPDTAEYLLCEDARGLGSRVGQRDERIAAYALPLAARDEDDERAPSGRGDPAAEALQGAVPEGRRSGRWSGRGLDPKVGKVSVFGTDLAPPGGVLGWY